MKRFALTALLLAALLLGGCANRSASATDVPATAAPTAADTTTAQAAETAAETEETTALPQLVTWQPDGIISDNEYPKQTTINGVDVFWRTDDTYLYLAARTRTIGWIAVGLAPDNRMMGANMIIGAIVDGKAVLEDHYGTGPTGHSADTGLGGTNDIAAFGGSQENGVTLWEAQIPLDSGDQYDKPLELRQTVAVIVATGASSNFSSIHSSRAAGQITLD